MVNKVNKFLFNKISILFLSLLVVYPAYAQTQDTNPIVSLLPLIAIVAVFYFLAIRPQQKKQKEHKKMISELKAGDEVVSAAGLYGKISKLSSNYMDLEIAKGVHVKLQVNAVSQVLPKGTIENLK